MQKIISAYLWACSEILNASGRLFIQTSTSGTSRGW